MLNPKIADQLAYQNAIGAYEAILQKYASNSYNTSIEAVKKQCYVAISELWLLQSENEKAIEVYERFLKKYPNDKDVGPLIHFANARSNEQIFNIDKAISEYQTVFDNHSEIADPESPKVSVLNLPLRMARLERGRGSKNQGKSYGYYREALNYYSSLEKQFPGTPTAFAAGYYSASIYLDQQQWQDAVTTFSKLIKGFPDRGEVPQLMLTVASLYSDGLRDAVKAGRIYDQIIQKFPEHVVEGYAHLGKARTLQNTKKYKQAIEKMKFIIDRFPQNVTLCASAQLSMAHCYEEQGDWQRALVEYKWVYENYSTTAQGLFAPTYIGQTYRERGEGRLAKTAFRDAVDFYQRIIKKYPKTTLAGTAQEYVINIYLIQEDWKNAEKAVEALETIYPGSRSKINTALLKGKIYENIHSVDQAIDVYKQLISEFPSHPILSEVRDKIGSLQRLR